ncbi:MAG: hypothetical protein JWO86_4052 [Myxococcaceae bacterium]|jgi:hypothetical protein|nr:hypothetical protein [Myxococcaceae bacterium]MEA2746239.1 hypothetical protein [Myxococcales bacterium]
MKNYALLGVLSVASLVVGAGSLACGSTVGEPAPATTPPAVVDPAAPAQTDPPAATAPAPMLDHGAVSTKYPAFTPAMGQLRSNGGSVLKNPVIVSVTWPGDTRVADLEMLGDTVGAGAYWKAVTSEYGSLAAISGTDNHLHLPDAAPTSISDTALATLVQTSLGKTDGTAWPVPATGDPVYILYLPETTDLILQGQSACAQGVGGYHDNVTVNGRNFAYAIVPSCSDFAAVTLSASHELAEAATDPYPHARPAWSGFRDTDLAWDMFQQFQSENGDACEFYRDSELAPGESDVMFTVQRQWSNQSGKAGHDPCVPAFKNTVYFNATPIKLEDINADLSTLVGDPKGTDIQPTKGFKVKVGETRQIPIGFYSDGPMAAWTIKAIAGGIAGGHGSASSLDLALDVTSGQNGEMAYLSVTVNAAGKTNTELVTIVSQHAGTSHYMPILIGN